MAPCKGKQTMHQKILNATASLAARGIKKAPRRQVAAMCGFPKETKSYDNSLRLLRKTKGYIVVDKETITLTELGLEHAEPTEPTESNSDILAQAKDKIKSKKSKQILDILADGRTHTRKEVGSIIDADPTKKSFVNLLSPLKTLNYIDYLQDDGGEQALRMEDSMFPFGRPGEDA
jgi:hypothetical protein